LVSALLFVLFGFIAGGVPTGYWTARILKGIDIRQHGSGSTGATNVWRCVGKGPGIFVFVVDLLKGYVPTALAHYLSHGACAIEWSFAPNVVPMLVALAALIGHSKSIFLGFQGGKSAATGLGTLFGLQPVGAALTFAVWWLVVLTTKYVSLASVIGVFTCGIWFALLGAPPPYVIYCVLGFLYVTYRHKANLKRLLNGTEPKFGDRPKDPPADVAAPAGSQAKPNSQAPDAPPQQIP
jgi:glycerol-3-phosphate acyltransferase PlsY